MNCEHRRSKGIGTGKKLKLHYRNRSITWGVLQHDRVTTYEPCVLHKGDSH